MNKKWIRVVCVAILVTALVHLLYAVFLKPDSNPVHNHNLQHIHVKDHGPLLESKSDRDEISGDEAKSVPDEKSVYMINVDDEVDFRIIVMTFDRAEALTRCLESLNDVDYFGDKIHIDVWIDRSKKDGSINNKTFTAASEFRFKHGTVKVKKHPKHVGLYGQWLNTWSPREDTREIAMFVEDDLTVSRHVYRWLKLVHNKYASVPYINGFSAQGKSIKHASGQGGLHGPETEVVFSYPVVGSWGFSPKPKNWLNFLSWFEKAHADPTFKPTVPGLIVSSWYEVELRRGRADSMWTMWHIYYAYNNEELTVYVNLPGKQGLAINWEEPGLHYKGARKTVNKDPILVEWDDSFANLPDEPVQLDAKGKVVKEAVRKTSN